MGIKKPRGRTSPPGLFLVRLPYGICRLNQVEIPFMPSRSTFWPSHTAKATGTDAPPLNCTSLGSEVVSARLYTTRHVGPLQQPPLSEPECSHTPFPTTS